jgi:nucleoside-diphosphate-sugar epimerase
VTVIIGVTGARGWVGSAVGDALRAAGHRVRPLVRERPAAGEARLDLQDSGWREAWPRAMAGCEAVVHCAAHVHRSKETPAEQALFADLNATATERLATAARSAGTGRLVYVSTIAVYGWSSGRAARETDPVAPETAYARSKLAGEAAVGNAGGDWVIARLATVFGRGDRANVAAMARAVKRGCFFLPRGVDPAKSLIAIDDAAEAIARLTVAPSAVGRVVNVAHPQPVAVAKLANQFARAFGVRPVRRLPLGPLRAAAAAADLVARLGLDLPLSRRKLAALCTSTVVSTGVLTELMGDKPWRQLGDQLAPHLDYYRSL